MRRNRLYSFQLGRMFGEPSQTILRAGRELSKEGSAEICCKVVLVDRWMLRELTSVWIKC